MKLEKFRENIDNIDNSLLELLNKRMEIVHQVGEFKQKKGSQIYHPEREKEILNRLKNLNKGKLTNKAIESIFIELFTVSRNLEKPESIAYLGPEATFTHQIAKNRFGTLSHYLPISSISGIFQEIKRGTAKFGVVPIENSSNGIVNDTILALQKYNLKIIAEESMDIHLSLSSNCSNIKDIKRIYSKDIAFGQCIKFLQNMGLENVEQISVESTAKAAQLAFKYENTAAICPIIAANLHKISILYENIEDSKTNSTRFFIISDFDTKVSGNDKTSILVFLENKIGSLVDFLIYFQKSKINLTQIKSHIIKGNSIFFIEFDGHKDDKKVQDILIKYKDNIKILGSYIKEKNKNHYPE